MAISNASAGLWTSLSVACLLTLILSLVMRELATGYESRIRVLGRNLDVVELPLMFVLFSIVLREGAQIVA
jgi:hypothetical protein